MGSVIPSFAVLPLPAVLVSSLVNRTILSIAPCSRLVPPAGLPVGDGAFGLVRRRPDDEIVITLREPALWAVPFTAGMCVGRCEPRATGRLCARVLDRGLPLTPAVTASAGYGPLVLSSEIAAAQKVSHLGAVTIVLSILVHSRTDIVVARWSGERDVPARPAGSGASAPSGRERKQG
ncbi:hypothetical protein AB0G15_33885 [Streptosporangium sp. NPDC023825]|uniref:hypothetical protein n=1 Tax=Streptosporangium sp. NPDC023825 TaxID=3154909 RepID=UPI0034277B19